MKMLYNCFTNCRQQKAHFNSLINLFLQQNEEISQHELELKKQTNTAMVLNQKMN